MEISIPGGTGVSDICRQQDRPLYPAPEGQVRHSDDQHRAGRGEHALELHGHPAQDGCSRRIWPFSQCDPNSLGCPFPLPGPTPVTEEWIPRSDWSRWLPWDFCTPETACPGEEERRDRGLAGQLSQLSWGRLLPKLERRHAGLQPLHTHPAPRAVGSAADRAGERGRGSSESLVSGPAQTCVPPCPGSTFSALLSAQPGS